MARWLAEAKMKLLCISKQCKQTNKQAGETRKKS